MIYFDNAATSWPKPPVVVEAITGFLNNTGASPGRSGHRLAVEASRIVYDTREVLTQLFNGTDPLRLAFTQNVTEALNLALRGLLHPGEHIITSSMEHNAMMRPLRALEKQGVEVTVVPCSPEGLLDAAQVEAAVRPGTKMIAANHASNVVGTLLPITDIGRIARRYELLFLVDTAQTAGAYPIDMQDSHIDLLAFTGHKALYGPTGTGGLIFGERVNLAGFEPLKRGGTGSRSETEEQPGFLPDLCESGTLNAVGLAGLKASVEWLRGNGIAAIRQHERELAQRLIDGLRDIPGITVYGTHDAACQTATVSFNIAGLEPSEVGERLDSEYAIMCRVGLHCAPAAHKTIGTFPAGTVRFGLGTFNTHADIDAALAAVSALARQTQ